jgi:hypothetical protein
MFSSSHCAPSPDDICLWPDGTWCHVRELSDYSHMSDDYCRIPTAEADALFEDGTLRRYCLLPFCSPPAANLAASLPVSAPKQGEGNPDCPTCGSMLSSLCHDFPDPLFCCDACGSEFNGDLSYCVGAS